MISTLEKLASRWEKEAGDYRRSAAESGLVDGAHPNESTAYQQACALQAGIYQTCSHQLRELIRKAGTATP